MPTVSGLIWDKLPVHRAIKQKVIDAAYEMNSHNRYPLSVCDIIDKEVNNGWQLMYLNTEILKVFEKHFDDKVEKIHHWINKYPPGGFQEPHTHGDCITFVYFVDIPENSGDLVFNKYIHDSVEGTICFFDGNLEHHVTENKSSRDRITIAGNIVVKL